MLDVMAMEGVRVLDRQMLIDLAVAAWLFAESAAALENFMAPHTHVFACQELAAITGHKAARVEEAALHGRQWIFLGRPRHRQSSLK
jgi:hypothetical protein